jgi:hypothetical protein
LRHQKLLPYWFWGLFSFSTAKKAKKGHKLILASGEAFAKPLVCCYGGKNIVAATLTH